MNHKMSVLNKRLRKDWINPKHPFLLLRMNDPWLLQWRVWLQVFTHYQPALTSHQNTDSFSHRNGISHSPLLYCLPHLSTPCPWVTNSHNPLKNNDSSPSILIWGELLWIVILSGILLVSSRMIQRVSGPALTPLTAPNRNRLINEN